MRADRDLLLAWDLLPKMDIATMSHGVEARSPFLDSELVAFASSIPASRVVGRWTTKPLLRALARRHLPPEVARAPKRGFEVPLDRWLAGPLRPLIEDTLLAPDAHIGQFAELSTIRRLATGDDDSSRRPPTPRVGAARARVVPAAGCRGVIVERPGRARNVVARLRFERETQRTRSQATPRSSVAAPCAAVSPSGFYVARREKDGSICPAGGLSGARVVG